MTFTNLLFEIFLFTLFGESIPPILNLLLFLRANALNLFPFLTTDNDLLLLRLLNSFLIVLDFITNFFVELLCLIRGFSINELINSGLILSLFEFI